MEQTTNINVLERELESGEVILPTDYLSYDGYLYDIEMLDMAQTEVDNRFVYLMGKYFYPYRGFWQDATLDVKPGIYWDDENKKLKRVDPISDEEKAEYAYEGKIHRSDPTTIREMVNSGKMKIQSVPQTSRAFITPVKSSDDILKRLIKMVFEQKQINPDDIRDQFADKNAYFNFKQVVKGDSRLSMMLFERGAAALNLKYSIMIEEIDPEHPLGKALSHNLVASSEDTYEM